MIQVFNIGNTHAECARWNGGELELSGSVPTAELKKLLRPGVPVAAATVVPAVRELLPSETFWLTPETAAGLLNFRHVDASTLGADRVANAVMLAETCLLPALAVDCGTAITIEIVDEKRRFRGGAIAPGRALLRRALAAGTAQLPEIPFSSDLPELPGVNTVEAIRFGVDRGAVGLVRELVAASVRAYGCRTLAVTGGDADFFAAALPELWRTPRDFTLSGILRAYQCCRRS